MELSFVTILYLTKIRLILRKNKEYEYSDFIREFIENNSDYKLVDVKESWGEETDLLLNLIKYRPIIERVRI